MQLILYTMTVINLKIKSKNERLYHNLIDDKKIEGRAVFVRLSG